jgi:hypothetical protein
MLRIHFTAEDLSRVRLRPSPDPMWELLLSLHLLQGREAPVVFGDWRRQARARLDRRYAPLLQLAPPLGDSPDFLTPPGVSDVDEGIDAVAATPTRALRADLRPLQHSRRPPYWAAGLAAGAKETRRELGGTLRRYYRTAVEPLWPTVRSRVDQDRARRAKALADGGVERLLSTLNPLVRWRDLTLEMPYPGSQDVHLDGRSLVLVPSFFCWRLPITLRDPGLPPVLVFPIEHDPSSVLRTDGERDAARSLAALLGRTRAAVLRAAALGGTTTELAGRVGVSIASASQHTSVLRDAGLLTTHRMGSAVHHAPTPLGLSLLGVDR